MHNDKREPQNEALSYRSKLSEQSDSLDYYISHPIAEAPSTAALAPSSELIRN